MRNFISIYFSVFGLANLFNIYLRLKVKVVSYFLLKCVLIKFATPNLSLICICILVNNRLNLCEVTNVILL